MAGFLVRRTGTALLVLFVTSIVVFLGVRAIPGDPVTVLSGRQQAQGEATPDDRLTQWVRHKYMLDKPLPEQYGHWLWLALHGDLGRDRSEQPIGRIIARRLPITFEVIFLSVLLAAVAGIPLGMLAAVRRGRPTDHLTTGAAVVGLSVPSLWLGFLLITWFAV